MPERSTGSMMFIGERCALEECHREDFLPFKCSDCRHHFCSNHFRPQTHRCESYDQSLGDYRVPLCPMCDNPPEGWRRDQDPNIAMDRHLSGQCPMLDQKGHIKSAKGASTSAPMKRTKKTNECTFVKCSKIMVVPIQCPECSASFCPSHRAPVQHNCSHKSRQSSPIVNGGSKAPTTSSGGLKSTLKTWTTSPATAKSESASSKPSDSSKPAKSGSGSPSSPFGSIFDKSNKWVPKPIFSQA